MSLTACRVVGGVNGGGRRDVEAIGWDGEVVDWAVEAIGCGAV